MPSLQDISISSDSARRYSAGDGMGDVRVFWIAAAIAVAAVVMVVAFKLEGRDLHHTLFISFSQGTQQMASPSTPAGDMPAQGVALKAEPHALATVTR